MSAKPMPDGGSAFPTMRAIGDRAHSDGGLTVRDYFAAAALQGLVANEGWRGLNLNKTAQLAWGLADAMLQERSA
jgi:hypothetical protein